MTLTEALENIITTTRQTDRLKPGMRSAEDVAGTTIKKGRKLTERNLMTLQERRRVWLKVYLI